MKGKSNMNQQQEIICTDCGGTHFFKNERFIRCECGNVIINPEFQIEEKNLKKDKQSFKETSIKIIFTNIFLYPIYCAILYVITLWLIGAIFGATAGVDGESIRGWFFAESADLADPLYSFLLESICHPIFFILLIIGFSIIGFSDCVKNEKTKLFFAKFGGIFIFILFLGGCANGCRIQSGFDKNRKNEKHYENMSMIATHMAIYHPNTDVDLGKIRVSGWSGKIDCDYCEYLNKIKGNH
jgi:hypothetical protein